MKAFQTLFPPLAPHTLTLSSARRIVLVAYNPARGTVDFRHFRIAVKPHGVSRRVRRVLEGDGERIAQIITALNEHARFLRGQLGRHIDSKFTPDLRFRHDESFAAAAYMDRLLADPRIQQDIQPKDAEDADGPQAAQGAAGQREDEA